MSIQRGNLKELYELSNIVEELDRKVLEAIKMAEERGLMQVARVLGTIKSYVDLLRRELEVKNQL
jgi:DNA-directed RNA polymerase specialized sigma subunit